jgi:NTE family protein
MGIVRPDDRVSSVIEPDVGGRMRMATTSGPVAFVLSGGGSLGAIQAGMLHALYERGITPDFLVASSVGALNGAFVASRPPSVDSASTLGELWTSLRHSDVFPISPWTALSGVLGKADHLISPAALRGLVDRWLEFRFLDEALIPLHVIVTDLLTGAERRVSTGDAAAAVLASAAFPGVFSPVTINGRAFIDGGVTNNTPVSHALALGARRVYVLPTGYACALREPPGSALGVATHALSLLTQQRLVTDIQHIPTNFPLTVLPPPCPLSVLPSDFSQAAELISRSREDSRAFLDIVDTLDGTQPAVPDIMRSGWHEHTHEYREDPARAQPRSS